MRRTTRLAALCASSVAALSVLPAWAGTIGPDQSFSSDGVVRAPGLGLDSVFDLATDGDAVVAVGSTEKTEKSPSHMLLSRFTQSGRPDAGFGQHGTRILNIGRQSAATSVDVLPGGDFLVAGWSINDRNDVGVVVLKLRPNGSLDQSFSNDGMAWIPESDGVNYPQVASDTAGHIWLAWSTYRGHYVGDYRMARLTPNGHVDQSFGKRGVKTVDENHIDWIKELAVDADGNAIIVGGSAANVHRSTTVVIRIDGDTNQLKLRRLTVWSTKVGTMPLGVGADDQGRVLVGLTPYSTPGWGAVRLLPSLKPDPSFSGNGIATHDCDCFSEASVVTDSGLLMLGATTEKTNRTILRGFTDTGQWDKSLAPTGPWSLTGHPYLSQLTLDASGRAVVAGAGGHKYNDALVARIQLG